MTVAPDTPAVPYRQLVVAAPGGHRIGWGHLVRSLALAELVPTSVPRRWASAAPEHPLPTFISLDGYTRLHADYSHLPDALTEPSVVIFDPGPALTASATLELEQQLTLRGHHVVAIDDLAERRFAAQTIVNHHPDRTEGQFQRLPGQHTRLFLGPVYALVRRAFRVAAAPGSGMAEAESPLVIGMGGADPLGLVWTWAGHLATLHLGRPLVLLVGSAQAEAAPVQLQALQAQYPALQVRLAAGLGAEALAQLLASAALVLCPGSTLALEALCVGARLLVGHYTADQVAFAQWVQRAALGSYLGELTQDPPPHFAQQVSALLASSDRPKLELRHVELAEYFGRLFGLPPVASAAG